MSEEGQMLAMLLGALFVAFTLGGSMRSPRGGRRRRRRPPATPLLRRAA